MSANAINPSTSGVSILFADPNLSFPGGPELRGTDAICVDLDRCVEPDGSLASKCLKLLENAEQKNVDVILAAHAIRFYEVPVLDKFSVTFVEKPETELTGVALANWIAGQIAKAMGLNDEVKRGLRRSRSVGKTVPGEVSPVHFESNLSKEQEKAFLNFVSGNGSQAEAAIHPAVKVKTFDVKKLVATKPAAFFGGGVAVGGRSKMNAAAAKALKAAKSNTSRIAASPKTLTAVSGSGPHKKTKS